MQEITRQADYYGLAPADPPSAPPQEKVADWLTSAQNWAGPARLEEKDEL